MWQRWAGEKLEKAHTISTVVLNLQTLVSAPLLLRAVTFTMQYSSLSATHSLSVLRVWCLVFGLLDVGYRLGTKTLRGCSSWVLIAPFIFRISLNLHLVFGERSKEPAHSTVGGSTQMGRQNDIQRFSCRQSSWHAAVSKADSPPFIWEGRQDHIWSTQRQVYLDYTKTLKVEQTSLEECSTLWCLLEVSGLRTFPSLLYIFSLQMLESAKPFLPSFDNCVFPDLHYCHLTAINHNIACLPLLPW